MSRCTVCFNVVVWCAMVGFATLLQAAEPFDLPDCTADFGSEVLLNAPLLEAMIPQAEPDGSRPDRQYETLFIVIKYYLERIQGLLLVTREAPAQQPLVLTNTCAPYPEAPAHIRAYLADLTAQQTNALVAYRDLVWPHEHRPSARPGSMAQIPAGAFKRSDGQTETLEAFVIDVYEVSNAQYGQFIKAAGYTTREFWSEKGWAWLQNTKRQQPSYWENAQLNAPEQPVVGVTWYEAEAYCRWAGKALPTELQWDKACRGTDGRKYPWGNEPLPQSTTTPENRPQFTVPAAVGSSPQTQSPYGVYDLAGNVLEWTQTMRDGRQIVLCGGSGDSQAHDVGCGVRYTLLPGISANFIGFRCQSTTP
jgi:formylglycine-generating enzyme required for sulfatase activity